MRVCRPWTPSEEKKLLLWWGHNDIKWIAHRLGRTPKAVERRAKIMKLRSTRDTETLHQFSKRTGYNREQILRAIRTLGLIVHRRARVSVPNEGLAKSPAARAITEEQGETILRWLKANTEHCWRLQGGGKVRQGVWGVGHKPPACIECGRTDRPHEAKGMCLVCYHRIRHDTPETRERARLRQRAIRAWRKAGNPGRPPIRPGGASLREASVVALPAGAGLSP